MLKKWLCVCLADLEHQAFERIAFMQTLIVLNTLFDLPNLKIKINPQMNVQALSIKIAITPISPYPYGDIMYCTSIPKMKKIHRSCLFASMYNTTLIN